MFTRMNPLVLVLAALIMVARGCAKPAPSTSVMDTPEYHYKNGLKYLDRDQIDDAMKSFDRAISLDPKSPLGYIGKGLAFGKKGDFKAAFDKMDKAKGYDKGVEARIGMIRLYTLQMVKESAKSKDLLKDAESVFKAGKGKD